MTQGQGGGPKLKYTTPEARLEARKASKKAYDLSEKRKLQRRAAKSAREQQNEDNMSLTDILKTYWAPNHPLCLSSRHLRSLPNRFNLPNPDWRNNVRLTTQICYSEALDIAWDMFDTGMHLSRWYHEWFDGPLYSYSYDDLTNRPLRHGNNLSIAQLESAMSGWWIKRIVTYFVYEYNSLLQPQADPTLPDIPDPTQSVSSLDNIWRSGTIQMAKELQKKWDELDVGYDWVERYTGCSFEVAYHLDCGDQYITIAQEYLFWQYQHAALIQQELRRRMKLDRGVLIQEVKSGKAPWQVGWRTPDAELWRMIRDLWHKEQSASSEGSSSSDSEDSSDDTGQDADRSVDSWD